MIFPKLYQAVKFIFGNYIGYEAEQEECNLCHAPPYCQMIEPDDETKFQIGICDFTDDEIIDNGDFSVADGWNVSGGWSIVTATPEALNDTGVAGTLSQEVDIKAGNGYMVRFRVSQWDDNASGNSAFVRLGGTEVIELSTAGDEEGEYIISVPLESPLTDSLFSVESETDVQIGIQNVSIMCAACDIPQLVINPTFNDPGTPWTFGGGWSYGSDDGSGVSGMAQFIGGGAGVLSQSVGIKAGCMYRVHFKILDNSLEDPVTIRVKIGGTTIFTIDENTEMREHIVYQYLSNTTNDLIEFDSDSGLDVEIDDILVYELCGMGFDVQDENDVSVFVDEGTHIETVAQGEVDWSSLTEGCYNICVYNLCRGNANLILNGEFNDTSVWNVSGEWGISGGSANVNGTGGGTLDQDVTLTAKTLYRVSYEVTQFGAAGIATVDIELNDQIIQNVGVTEFTGKYSHIVEVDTVVNNKIEFVIIDDGNTLQFMVDNVKVEQMTGCGSNKKVTNGLFSNDSDWTKGGNWTISGGNASNIISTASDILSQTLALEPNTTYTFSIEIVSFVGPSNVLTVKFDGNTILTFDSTSQLAGTYTATFTTSTVISSQLLELDAAINNGLTIDNVSILGDDCGAAFCSECYTLRNDHPCSVLLTWTNPKNTMGYNYVDFDFVQSLRIEALLRRATYTEDFNVQVTESGGDKKQVAVRSRKQQQLAVSQAPEYIHEAIEQGAKHMEFKIDDVEYIRVPGDYTPNWRDRSLVAAAILDVQEKSQPNREMTNC